MKLFFSVMVLLVTAFALAINKPQVMKRFVGSQNAPAITKPRAVKLAQLIVRHPWRPGRHQKGVAIYMRLYKGEKPASVRLFAQRTLNYAVSLGANSVSVSFPFFINGIHGTRIYGTKATPSPGLVKDITRQAHQQKLRVTLRPLMDEANLIRDGWRGSIQPTDRVRWFVNYRRWLRPYLQAAKSGGATTFVIAVELNSLVDDPLWTGLLRWARRLYPGQLSYSANWDGLRGTVVEKTRPLSIDAYFNTSLPDSASVSQITTIWNNWLRQLGLANLRAVVLSEVGIAAESGAYRHPALWGNPSARFNGGIQQHWFTAACRAFQQNRLAGIYFWRLNLVQQPSKPASAADRGAFAGRQGARAVRQCFRAR